MAERRLVCAASAGAGESCVELRLRQQVHARWTYVAGTDADRRVHAQVPGSRERMTREEARRRLKEPSTSGVMQLHSTWRDLAGST